jgi:crotonobetaine/carnitine-CoA ligase
VYHIDARHAVIATVYAKATLALADRFSVRNFWPDVNRHEADVFAYIGTMLHLLYKQEPSPADADVHARIGMGGSTPETIHRAFEQRFGLDLIEGYGMTELGFITSQRLGAIEPGHTGRPVDSVDVRLVDPQDRPVPVGTPGELTFRTREPHIMMQGYWNRPEATVEAWRNLWFHTGDIMREDAAGNFRYIGRNKDSIRRRGENVSAWEVEQTATKHPDILDAAAIPVPSSVGEDDVALLVVLRAGCDLSPADIRTFVQPDLPKFAVPRFVEIMDSFPKTPSQRVEKGRLRERGISEAAWDGEPAR